MSRKSRLWLVVFILSVATWIIGMVSHYQLPFGFIMGVIIGSSGMLFVISE